MSPRSTSYFVGVLLTAFIGAWEVPRLRMNPINVIEEVILVSMTMIFAVCAIRHERLSNPSTMRSLISDIHAKAVAHLDNGHNILAPSGLSACTSTILLGIDPADGTVMIQERPIDGACRRYSISADGRKIGRLVVKVGASSITAADRQWCHAQLTTRRLAVLLEALSTPHLYVPRRAYSAA